MCRARGIPRILRKRRRGQPRTGVPVGGANPGQGCQWEGPTQDRGASGRDQPRTGVPGGGAWTEMK